MKIFKSTVFSIFFIGLSCDVQASFADKADKKSSLEKPVAKSPSAPGGQKKISTLNPKAAAFVSQVAHDTQVALPEKKQNSEATQNLMHAYERRDFKKMEEALAAGADVNCKFNDGSTPLHYFATYSSDMVEYLLSKKADAVAKDSNGARPLSTVITCCMASRGKLALDAIKTYKLLVEFYTPDHLNTPIKQIRLGESDPAYTTYLITAVTFRCPFLVIDLAKRGASPKMVFAPYNSLLDHIKMDTSKEMQALETMGAINMILGRNNNGLPIRSNLEEFPVGIKEELRDRVGRRGGVEKYRVTRFVYPADSEKTVTKKS